MERGQQICWQNQQTNKSFRYIQITETKNDFSRVSFHSTTFYRSQNHVISCTLFSIQLVKMQYR